MDWQKVAVANGCKIEQDVPLARLTSFRVGGPAAYVVSAPAAAVAPLLKQWKEEQIPFLMMGNGSNLLASDKGYSGVVLRLLAEETPVLRGDNRVMCQAGMQLKALCLWARDHGLAGLEPLYGIPGTVGGAVFMNAGAYGGEVADVLTEVSVVDRDGEIRTLSAEEAALGYRHSRFMDTGEVVLQVILQLKPDRKEDIGARMDDFQQRRRDKQPLEYPSAGSFFKRPVGHFAGALIDQCGLRGFAVGDAQVSEKHAGFVINRGKATCKDILTLSDEVQRRVFEKFGVQLEREVRFIGEAD